MQIDHHYIEALHIIAVVAWMVGMLYLPRIFVYHCSVEHGSESDLIFRTMERRLMNFIMTPAMLVSIILGIILAYITGHYIHIWLHIKFLFVAAMLVLHLIFNCYRCNLANGSNQHSTRFFKIINEVVTIIFIIIVFLAVVKPFR